MGNKGDLRARLSSFFDLLTPTDSELLLNRAYISTSFDYDGRARLGFPCGLIRGGSVRSTREMCLAELVERAL